MNGFRTETRSDTEAQGIWEIFLYSWEINTKSKGHKSKNKKKKTRFDLLGSSRGHHVLAFSDCDNETVSLSVKIIKS